MDAGDTLRVLDELGRRAPGALLLWRGPELDGSDVDLVMLPGREADLVPVLRELGLTPAWLGPGRWTWRRVPGDGVRLDLLEPWAWPAHLPALDGVAARAEAGPGGLPVAGADDRRLVFAAEALAGRPVDRAAAKLAALGPPGPGLDALAARLDARPLAVLARRLPALGDGRVPLRRTLRAALACRLGRAALVTRLGGRGPAAPPGAGRRGHRGRLIALSGVDGSGKSTLAVELVRRLEAEGGSAIPAWTRLAVDSALLDVLAGIARTVQRRPEGPIADHSGARDGAGADAAEAAGGPVARAWALVVAADFVRGTRRLARLRRRGIDVVCDRWLADAVVDLRVRYGHQPLAEAVLRHGVPRPDVAVLLELDAATAAARKPGDQPLPALRASAERFAELADRHRLHRVDARRPPAAVLDDLARLLPAA